MNSVLSRAPGRRGVRRPGWTLMTALLILAIAASSALVFTSRVELLKLAVIIALWAAVAAAFVSVIYRRQSDVDQARARDLKLVYDLQLDREISARREYELTVESQLRRELASELRAQAADEVAALRAELSALRTNLEILFDADLSHRPALEPERTPVRAYSDWARSAEQSHPGATRIGSSAATSYAPDSVTETAENPIIDVPEVRIPSAGNPPPQAPQKPQAPHVESRRGSHRRSSDESQRPPEETPPSQPAAARWAQPPQPFIAPEPRREPEPPQPPPAPQPAPRAGAPTPSWKPVGAEGEWLPPGAPGSHWSADVPAETGRHGVSDQNTEAPGRHGRHSGPAESAAGPVNGAEPARHEGGGRRRARSRHAADPADDQVQPTPVNPAPPPVVTEPQAAEPAAPAHGPAASRHSAGADGSADGPSTGGQSVADLLARLQPTPTEGRRHRRRED
ncbi:hypothetical protein A5649_02585 [Mycolicibacter heraklionensis]|uniref:DUF6779 domain-containing protein n=1 Tax=Mycolicibacter heraklionensis TaxID=512402 RepID=A0AA91IXT5_9MYCO|nr:DUF6779 domain-containing protein [Mycolicibacter heraklionensis]OBK85332.1 hypothetical protein A5649_02585 [Mycolicibacter heraklionensis]